MPWFYMGVWCSFWMGIMTFRPLPQLVWAQPAPRAEAAPKFRPHLVCDRGRRVA